MARRRRKSRLGAAAAAVVLVAVALAALVITYGEKLNLPFDIPTWSEIGAYLGIKKPVEQGEAGKDPFQLHFIDVGNADATLIVAQDKHILIDAGENDMGGRVVRYLKDQGVEKLDLVIGTHPHSDHIGGLDNVIQNFEIGTLMMPKIPDKIVPTSKTYTDVLKAAKAKQLSITAPKPGDKLELGGATFTILGPGEEYDDLNNLSIVTKVDYKNFSALLTGDAEKEAESDLLDGGWDLTADVLKVGHHGSSTSSSKKFLQAVNPATAVIHVGTDNSYGHPTKSTLERLRDAGASIYRTDLNGTVIVGSDGTTVHVNTEK